ncbi:hypothetical protein CcaverHIS002_0507920 [Cutaneotrichosporon cavernicola]|uniref:Uncharacterized protein n=1 Tax=Cutaneotrichosporon cavernicola TaxID=279322 RepID=A0AA48L776_9TREE|nr:uncharacterized protein CcaverHIS019_0508500 [Cutaneotrichosporon cavernicola]BEI85391.1 hypothetical protein CcaverHIS002_0507920 [Cutaneotrichosporon cavernicola]BEI93222.1 hypothetical protein CcaverHIS019_0508500 [Cutaneotrichosporon cavernicola]BEJ08766.1 hypothetical protein CcaverHIS641_0508600 [Cutaneotrichosporon cavernicola]
MADEAGDFEIAETDTRVEGHVPVLADRGRREGKARTWRDVDTSNLPPLKKEDVKFFPLPADFDNTITAATSRRTERISVRYPLFIGTSMPASHVPGGGALFPPPFVPPLHAGVFPDGMAANSREREHLARRSNDARAGTGFVFPTPGSARVFVLASKARVSTLSVERRRCRARFLQALKLVINRSDDVPPLNHNRVYSFVLHPSIHDAPFKDICETVEKAIREMDRKLKPTPRGQPRWTTHKS